MGVPDIVKEKVGEIKDMSGMDKAALEALVKEYYQLSVSSFSDRFDVEHQVKVSHDQDKSIVMLKTSQSVVLRFLENSKNAKNRSYLTNDMFQLERLACFL